MEAIECSETLKNKLRELAQKGHVTCDEAHQLAEAEGVSLIYLGKLIQATGARIRDCQLGCFGKYKE